MDDKDVQPLLQLSRAEGVDSKDEHGQGVASDEDFIETLMRLAELRPRLLKSWYWSGTSPVILEDTHHRQSYDIDLHTYRALRDVRPLGVEPRHPG